MPCTAAEDNLVVPAESLQTCQLTGTQQMEDTREAESKEISDYSRESLLERVTMSSGPAVPQKNNGLQRMMQSREEQISDYPLVLALQQDVPNRMQRNDK